MAITLAVAAALAGAGIGTYLLIGGGTKTRTHGVVNTSSTTSTSVTSTTGTPQGTAPAALASIESLLQQSNAARNQLSPTVSGVLDCSIAPRDGVAAVQNVITTRNQIINSLNAIMAGALPDGATITSDLSSAEQVSVQADQDYQNWMNNIAASSCAGSAPLDANYMSATDLANQSTNSKVKFLSEFNPLAAQYGLRQWMEPEI